MSNSSINSKYISNIISFSLFNNKIYYSNLDIYSYDPDISKREFYFKYGIINNFVIDDNNKFIQSGSSPMLVT